MQFFNQKANSDKFSKVLAVLRTISSAAEKKMTNFAVLGGTIYFHKHLRGRVFQNKP